MIPLVLQVEKHGGIPFSDNHLLSSGLLQGLPSAFLAPTSLCDMDDTGVPGTSLSSHSSLASSLTELAGGLGSTPGGPGERVVPAALTEAGQTSNVPEADTSTKADQSRGVYNPFDSDGTSCIYIALFASSHLTFRCHFSELRRLCMGLVTRLSIVYTVVQQTGLYMMSISLPLLQTTPVSVVLDSLSLESRAQV